MEEENKNHDNQAPESDEQFLLEQITEDVRELERYVKEFSEFLPLPVILITPVKNVVDVNNAFKKLMGYDEMEIIGQQIDFIFESKSEVDKLYEHLEKYGEVKQLEMEIMAKNRKKIPVSVAVSHRKDTDGNVVGFFIAFSDIRAFKKLQDDLEDKVKERTGELEKMQKILLDTLDEIRYAKDDIEKEKNKTAAIISNFPDPVMVVDTNWQLMLFNPAAAKVFSLGAHNLGQKINTQEGQFSFNDFKPFIKTDYEVKEIMVDEEGKPLIEEVMIKAKEKVVTKKNPFSAAYVGYEEGSTVYKVITAPVYDDNNVYYGNMKIFFDLTREKMVDKLKSEFISIAAHQLRTPLSAIKWAIKLVLDEEMGRLNEMQKKTLSKGYVSNERIIKLVNDMLDVSRIEEGRFGYELKQGDISEPLQQAIENLENQIKEKQIRFNITKPEKIPPVLLDKEKMTLALQNVLENSVTYTPEFGQITIDVKEQDEKIKILITDNGVGVPTADQEKLFTKFFRASNVVRMQTDGSGLGLFIVKNIIEKHGGEVKINSEEGRGTTCKIVLPIKN